MSTMDRRDFLKATPLAAAGAMTLAAAGTSRGRAAGDVRISSALYTPLPDYPIHPQPYFTVTLTDTFWKPKVETNARVTIPFEVQKLAETERHLTGNVLEAAMLSLRTHPNPALQAEVDAAIEELRLTAPRGNATFEVAAALYATTGRRDLLEPAIAAANLLYDDFVVNDPPFSGGERDAINCVQLYRATHEKKHLDLAKHYLDIRGLESSVNRSRHNQSNKPVLEQSEAVGHAVNCVSLMVSLADVGVLTGLKEYFDTAERMWRDAVTRKMYVTGGVGATGNEGFGEPYALPNISAYSETCAVLMFITFNHRMFLATGDGKYIDVMERGMYNNALSGVSASGDRFFYVNRLASAGDGRDTRWQRASLECCPPNLVRFLAGMPGLVYAQNNRTVYVNLYVSSESTFTVDGKPFRLSMQSEMPWGGRSRLTVTASGVTGTLKLRIPGWARNQPVPGALYACADRLDKQPTISVNGRPVPVAVDTAGYVSLNRRWNTGDIVTIDFPMDVRRVVADERVRDDRRKMAVERGPMVYCLEAHDVAAGGALDLLFDLSVALSAAIDDGFYGGVTVIHAEATRMTRPSAPRMKVKLIPYFLWANRGAAEMTVWLSTSGYVPGDVGPAGGPIFFENPRYESDGWRYLEAAPFDQSAGATWGCFRRAIAGARGTAIGTGKQNTAEILAACDEPNTAAALCSNLSVRGLRGWFLPSRDKLAAMYRVLGVAGAGDFRDGGAADNFTYWASSQASADMAHHIDFADAGRQHYDDKDFPRRVRAIRQI